MTQRILFITLSCVGDAVMTTPVLEALHGLYPDAGIDIVADKRSSYLFSQCPYRGEIIHKHKHKPFRGALRLIKRLRPVYYDLIVDLRTDGLAYFFRGSARLTKWHAKPYGPHSVEQHMGVIRKVYGDREIPPATIWLSEKEKNFADEYLTQLPGGRTLVIGPASGAKEQQKTWPAESYSSLADRLSKVFSGLVLIGSGNDKEITARVAAKTSLPLLDLAGQTDLLQAAAILKRAAMFIGSDSGLGHIAAAMGRPTLSLFSHADPQTYLPWGSRAEWIKGAGGDARKISVADAEKRVREMLQTSASL